ncbi:MAG: GNAT family N-acetyltransferase [Phycisphaeraceae bacterium]|nr:GNAT family N-acetyltransferase [Phycisphaeraceae bacterium]
MSSRQAISTDLPDIEIRKVSQGLLLAAATRLLSAAPGSPRAAARRFLASAPEHQIDPSLMWVSLGPEQTVREVCLAVIGSGRTANLFLGPPDRATKSHGRAERSAVAAAALEGLSRDHSAQVRLAQALCDPSETASVEALLNAGFRRISDLAYMERPFGGPEEREIWPDNLSVESIQGVAESAWRPALLEALEVSYEDTLDCPELCGLRSTSDVLASHLATGEWDPAYWWIIREIGRPVGCLLFSSCPELRAVELVYLGVGRAQRGRGYGRSLLRAGLSRVSHLGASRATLAVDRRNIPAMRLYESLGFDVFASRIALVKPLS